MSSNLTGGLFDGLPIPAEKSYLKKSILKVDESWAAARFDSLPHVVQILTSKDRDGDIDLLRERCDVIEEVVDEVVHAYHSGFNKAIQNYSQILRLFSESTQSITSLKTQLAEAKNFVGSRNKQLRQLWYRSLTLRHIITLLDQIESVSKVPSRIENLISEKQLYAAVQLHVQSTMMLEREGLQAVGAMQDVRSELTKLRGVLFYKILDDLHNHLYNKGEYSSESLSSTDEDALVSNVTSTLSISNTPSLSRRTRSMKENGQLGSLTIGDGNYRLSSVDGSSALDGLEDVGTLEASDVKQTRASNHQIPAWLSCSTPDEFIESMKKSDASMNVKYLQTLVECLCMLGKVAAAGAIICQRLRPTIHEIITSKIKAFASAHSSSCSSQHAKNGASFYSSQGLIERQQTLKGKVKGGASVIGTQIAVSPVSPAMTPTGTTQTTSRDLLGSILDSVVLILENHVTVGELLESKSLQQSDNPHAFKSANLNADGEASQITGGFSLGFSLSVIQSECQQLICEILRATPEAASADAAVQTARLANNIPSKDKRDGSDGLSFAFRFTDTTVAMPNQGGGQNWRNRPNVLQEGYGTAAVLPEQGLYLAASIYRPVLQFSDKLSSILPEKHSQNRNDGLLAFAEKFLKDHFLPAMFVDYRKYVQQAISSPAAFRPRAHTTTVYDPLVEKGRPVLQGLLAIDFLAKEVFEWAQAIPKYANELVDYVITFLERTYERCRASFMEAVLEKQSYMLIGRHDFEKAMRFDPSSACLPGSRKETLEHNAYDEENSEYTHEMCNILIGLRPIKQEYLIHDDNKIILLASLSDSLEYLVDTIERLADCSPKPVQSSGKSAKDLKSIAAEYRKLAVDCLRVLRVEMQLETIFHIQEMISRNYMEDQDAEEPDDYIISLTTQIMRRDEHIAPFVSDTKRGYIFGGISAVASIALIKALTEIKCMNLLGVQQVCRNSIAIEQAVAAIPAIDYEAVRQLMDRVRTYYELLNLPFDALLAFISEHEFLFTSSEYLTLSRIKVPGRDIPDDAEDRVAEVLKC